MGHGAFVGEPALADLSTAVAAATFAQDDKGV
jgi:hypothetical protein